MTPARTSPLDAARPPTATPREQVFPGRSDQVREARKFLATVLNGCPVTDDAILCLSELVTNSVLHSDSGKAGGTFTVRAEIHEGDYVWIEVEDGGGPWNKRGHSDGRPHGLDIIGELASAWGIDGDPLTGWVVWTRFDVPPADPPNPGSGGEVTAPASGPALGAEVTSQAMTGLRAALAALGIATAGLTLTRYSGKLHPEDGPVIGYHAGLYWWPARRRHASRPIYAIHDARDPAGAARRIAPHHQPASPAEH
jgi:serine/threonine-protein kinase RsbW